MTAENGPPSRSRAGFPEECQLCRLNGYRGDEIQEPEGSVTIAREDGGVKFVYCCERCAEEAFSDADFVEFEAM